MSPRAASWLAWSLFALALLILSAGLPLWSPDMGFYFTFALVATPFAVVGVLVASRRPRNPIGWLFLVFGVVAAFTSFGDRYASYALVEYPGSLPGGAWVAWLSSGIWHPAFGFFVFAFLLFPNGRLPSARWRPVAWIAAANYLMGGVLGLLWGPLFGEFFPYADFPFRLPGYDIADAVFGIFIVVNFGLLALSAVSLVLRLRRAAGVELTDAVPALAGFAGTGRRFEERGTTPGGARVFDDYAHHPTEVRATLEAAHTLGARRMVACFQPHLYSRTRELARDFGRALALADLTVVLDIYPARERAEDFPGVSGLLVAQATADAAGGRPVWWLPAMDTAADRLQAMLGEGDVVLTLGAGDVDRLAAALTREDT